MVGGRKVEKFMRLTCSFPYLYISVSDTSSKNSYTPRVARQLEPSLLTLVAANTHTNTHTVTHKNGIFAIVVGLHFEAESPHG